MGDCHFVPEDDRLLSMEVFVPEAEEPVDRSPSRVFVPEAEPVDRSLW